MIGSSGFSDSCKGLSVERLGVFSSGAEFDSGGAEIASYSKASGLLYSTNGAANAVDAISIKDPEKPVRKFQIHPSSDWSDAGDINSLAASESELYLAVAHRLPGERGSLLIYTLNGEFQKRVMTGVLPDMIKLSPDKKWAVVANEAEPYLSANGEIIDPAGGVSILNLKTMEVKQLGFESVKLKDRAVRTALASELGVPLYHDLEPEYIAISSDSKRAFVVLQENNAVATIDLEKTLITRVDSLHVVDHSMKGNELDLNSKDKEANLLSESVLSIPLPDGIDYFEDSRSQGYLITANEGEKREIENQNGKMIYSDLIKAKSISDAKLTTKTRDLREHYLDLRVLKDQGLNSSGQYDNFVLAGTRSFSIFNADTMQLVFDSGSQIEKTLFSLHPELHNTDDDRFEMDRRSSRSGPAPEAVVVGKVREHNLAFVSLEKPGGVMIYELQNPRQPLFCHYISGRNLNPEVSKKGRYKDTSYANTGDLSPEGLYFINEKSSPVENPLLIVSNEVSGTIEIYSVSNKSDAE